MYGTYPGISLGGRYGTGRYSLKVTTPPTAEPLDLDEGKLHLCIDDDQTIEDAYVGGLIAAARWEAEKYCGQCWLTQTLAMKFDGWPTDGEIRLPVEPVQSVTTIKYYDVTGTQITWSGANWQTWLDHSPPLILPAPMTPFPGLQVGKVEAVEIVFVAGNAQASGCPPTLKAAIQLIIGYWHGFRGDGKDPTEHGLPVGAIRLLESLNVSAYR